MNENNLYPEVTSLAGSILDFISPNGSELLNRVRPFHEWLNLRRRNQVWPYAKILNSIPNGMVSFSDEFGTFIRTGVNFAIQDYLGLTRHPDVKQSILEIVDAFGPHSAGSPMLAGNSSIAKKLELEIAKTFNGESCMLFPSGWMAGFGAIQGMVRKDDHIVLDQLAHACLMVGATSATQHVHRFRHNDVQHLSEILKELRSRDGKNSILVITEGLFSMDSDVPPLEDIQSIAHDYGAILLVDVAHDFGSMGPNGTGEIGRQGMLGKVDVVMGSFSKTFACNGGFLVCAEYVRDYLSVFSSPYAFSNSISPIQCAIAARCLSIVKSEEGEVLRKQNLEASIALRSLAEGYGLHVLGAPSPIVPILLGDEATARVTAKRLNEVNVLANLVEYPAVGKGKSRFRFQVMASHTDDDCRMAAVALAESMKYAKELLRDFPTDEKSYVHR